MIEIQTLNKEQLAAFVQSEAFSKLPNLPISRHRAASQEKNPRASDDDILLLLACLEDEIVGYLGMLPDQYYVDAAHFEKCCWLSCLWVSEQHRGKSIAKILLTQGVAAYGGRALLTEFAPRSKVVYERLGFFTDLRTQQGIRLYYRLDLHHLLAPKRAIFRKIKPLLQAIDALGNVMVDAFRKLQPTSSKLATYSYSEEISDDIQHFIADKQGAELFKRGQNDLNWAIKNPWVLASPPDDMSRRYYFSSVDRTFDFVCIKVYDAELRLRAFLILAKRHRNLKIPCCYLTEGAAALAAEVIDQHIHHWRINTFSTYHPELVQHYSTNRTFALYKKPLKRVYIAANQLADSLVGRQYDLQDGDGDCFFT